MKKQLRRVLAALIMLCMLCSSAALADNVRTSGLYTYKIKGNGTISIVDFDWKANQGDIYIPSMVDGYTVTAIDDEAFANGNADKAAPALLVIPNTVTIVGERAFYNSPITTVSIPASLQSIGEGAFSYCSITQFIVDPTQPSFAAIDGVLYNKKNRTLLTYPQNCAIIAPIPEGITAIEDYAFCGVTFGGYDSISSSGTLLQFNELFPSTITSIGAHAFENCTLYYGAAMNTQGGAYFFNSSGETKLLPDGVKEIGDAAFAGTTFRNGGYNAPSKIVIGAGIESIGDEAFKGCRWYDNAEYDLYLTNQQKMDEIGDYAFADSEIYSLGNETAAIRIVLPEEIDTIGDYAFADTHWVNAGSTACVDDLGMGAFQNTVVFSNLKKEMYMDDMPQTLQVWGDIKEVPDFAFSYSYKENSLSEINIQDGIKEIGEKAFSGLSMLKKVTLPESLEIIGERAFENCANLTELTLPADVEEIGDYAFDRQTITLTVERDSFAALWASENGYNYRYSDELAGALDWLGVPQETPKTIMLPTITTPVPTTAPTPVPTAIPTPVPTAVPIPTSVPAAVPTAVPTLTPAPLPTVASVESPVSTATLSPTAVPTPTPSPTATVSPTVTPEPTFAPVAVNNEIFEGNPIYHYDRFDESWMLEAKWEIAGRNNARITLSYTNENVKTCTAPELNISCVSGNETAVDSFRAIIDNKTFVFEGMEKTDDTGMAAGGPVLRAFLASLADSNQIAFQFEVNGKKITLDSVRKDSLAQMISAAVLLERSGAWFNIAEYEENDARYSASVRIQEGSVSSQTVSMAIDESAYEALQTGDKGDAVRTLQQKLIDLKYFTSVADGYYAAKTETAVRLFQQNNRLEVTGTADGKTLWILYETEAISYEDPEMVLYLDPAVKPRIEETTKDRCRVSFQVTSTARTKKVKAFELFVYIEDVWGKRLNDGETIVITTERDVKPESSARSAVATIEDYNEMSRIYAGLHKVAYEDESIYTVPENEIEYVYWDVK